MNYINDKRIVLTLDAGGTNFSFRAIRSGELYGPVLDYPAKVKNLDECLSQIIYGFEELKKHTISVDAISFSFPGPADYPQGVIGQLDNLPCFDSYVALGSFLADHFNVPVYINNDGDLFVYGEAKFGFLKETNNKLQNAGLTKRYNGLIGVTLGTGFGGGAFINGSMLSGDNSSGMEVWTTRNHISQKLYAEEGISKRAIINFYGDLDKTPKDIYDIAMGTISGNKNKALESFIHFGSVLGESLADLITLFDCPVVIGGGLSRSYSLFMPTVMSVLAGDIYNMQGKSKKRIVQDCYFLNFEKDYTDFLQNDEMKITVPNSNKMMTIQTKKKIPIGLRTLGTNQAISLGAYAYAIDQLNKEI